MAVEQDEDYEERDTYHHHHQDQTTTPIVQDVHQVSAACFSVIVSFRNAIPYMDPKVTRVWCQYCSEANLSALGVFVRLKKILDGDWLTFECTIGERCIFCKFLLCLASCVLRAHFPSNRHTLSASNAILGLECAPIVDVAGMFTEALEFCKTRKLFGKSLAETQTVQRRLADMCRRITTAQLLSLQLGRLKDAGQMQHSQVSLAKWNNVRMALDIARDARDLLGAGGISVEFSAIRHMLNLESVITYEGTETIHELSVGRALTGHAAF